MTPETPLGSATGPLHRGWLYGALFGVLAVFVRASLQPLLGNELPFMVAFPTIVVAAVLFGWRAGAMASIVTVIAVLVPQIPPNLPAGGRPLQVGGFLIGSILISLFCGQVNAQRDRAAAQSTGQEFETPLSSWLRAVLWGAFLVPVTVFLIAAWWGYERAQREAENTVVHAADLAYRHAQRSFEVAEAIGRRADLASAGDDDAVHANEAAIHQRLGDIASGVTSVVNLNVWDASGHALARSDLFPVDRRANVADRAYFQAQRAASAPLGISEVIQGRQTGRELTNVTLRRASADGRFTGIVAVSLSPGYFRDYYQSLAREQPNLATFALIRTDGTLIARWPPTPDERTQVPAASPILHAIEAGEHGGTVLIPENDGREARIASFRRLDEYPLYVVAGVSRQAMFAGWFRFVALLAATLLPVSAGLVYVSWVALKKTRLETATAKELQAQIRRRHSAEQGMLQSQRLETLAAVTGGVAHDFNNLLAIVSTSLHVLKRRHPELAEEKQVQAMTRAIQSGVRLTRQLLSFTRKQALRPETVELQSWVPATEGLIRTTLGSNIRWQARVEPDTRSLHVDVGELELALINLVVNARHAMPEGGALTLQVANAQPGPDGPARAMVEIAVGDTGVGIPPELLARVFEPFFTTRSKGAGSGLGLSQVQGFCAQAGGSVKIQSTVGQGTTVSMLLPAAEAGSIAEPAAPAQAIRLSGRLLLVEDNEDVASTTELLLRAAGLEIVRRTSADAALAYLAGNSVPDAVLSDIAMPGSLDGIALAFRLRELHPELPVLLTTGYAEHLHQALAGGLRVLPKPVAPDELLGQLRAVLKADAAGSR